MEELAIYLIKSAAVLAVFVLTYHFLLRRLTFFQANRYFLLFGLFASIVFPLIEITQTVYVEQPSQAIFEAPVVYTPVAAALELPQAQEVQSDPVDPAALAYVFYTMLALFFIGKMLLELGSLRNLIKSGEITRRGRFLLVSLSRKLTPFSFFHYICFTDTDEQTPEFELIFNHEKVHASQWHSLDVILSTLYRAVFWFNPLAWWVKRQITENLEFIADAEAKAANTSSISYERTLLSVMASHPQPALANNFFTPSIKRRIIMLQKETSARWHAYKYALVLPVIVLFLYSFNIVEKVEYVNNESAISVEKASEFPSQSFQINSLTLKNELEDITSVINKSSKYEIEFSKVERDQNNEITKIVVSLKFMNPRGQESSFVSGDTTKPIDDISIRANKNTLDVLEVDSDYDMTITRKGITLIDKKYSAEDTYDKKIQEKMGPNPLYVFDDKSINREDFPEHQLKIEADMITQYKPSIGLKKFGAKAKDGAYVYKGAKLKDYLKSTPTLKSNQDEVLIIKLTSESTQKQLEDKVMKLKEKGITMDIKKAKFKKGKLVKLKFSIDDGKGYTTSQSYDTSDGISTTCISRIIKKGKTTWSIDDCSIPQAYLITDEVIKDAMITIKDEKLDEKLAILKQQLAISNQQITQFNLDSSKMAIAIGKVEMDSLMIDMDLDMSFMKDINLDSLTQLIESSKITLDSTMNNLSKKNLWTVDVGINKVSVLESTLYVVDGKIISQEEGLRLNPDRIYSITELFPYMAIKKYGDKAKDGAVEIQLNDKDLPKFVDENYQPTSKPKFNILAPYSAYKDSVYLNAIQPKYAPGNVFTSGTKPIIVVNGKIQTESTFRNLTPDKIKAVSVFKGEEAINLYGVDGKNGVIIVEYDGTIDMDNLPESGSANRPISLYVTGDKNSGSNSTSFTKESTVISDFTKEELEEYGEGVREKGYEFKIRTFRTKANKIIKLKLDFAGSTYTIENESGIKQLKFEFYGGSRKPIMSSISN